MNIAIIGQGYVGLTAALCFADAGHFVYGVERNQAKLASLNEGSVPFFEPGLQELMARVTASGHLVFQADMTGCTADAVVVAVGTPTLRSGGADLRFVWEAMKSIRQLAEPPALVMVKSTIPPGTSERILSEAPDLSDRYCFSPEFLSLGTALEDWQRPSRVVVGFHNKALLPVLEDLYRGIEAPWVSTTPTNAEMIKYASNAFLATKVSFINEIANLCEGVGADVTSVSAGLRLDPRIGSSYLNAGVGYGGSCFPKDTQALAHLSRLQGRSMPLLEAVIAVNNSQRLKVVSIVQENLRGAVDKTVAVLGLSFKPGTDDVREAPSLTVVSELMAHGFDVRMWDPVVSDTTEHEDFFGALSCESMEEAVQGASAVVVLTEWQEIRNADWTALIGLMAKPAVVIDGRNCLDKQLILSRGASYRAIGRANAVSDSQPAAAVLRV